MYNTTLKCNINVTCDRKESTHGKCSKISNSFLFLFSNKMLVIRAGIHKLCVKIASREDPDGNASSEAV